MGQFDDRLPDGVDIDGVREHLGETPVRFALLFGSHARGTADTESDVDIALSFPDEMSDRERFRCRNRIDAELQAHVDGFADVSDIDSLPTHVAYAALRDGRVLVGDERTVEEDRRRLRAEYERTEPDRERERREFIDRLARGET
jgi:predicted nucleotidyltransferase